MSAASFRIGQRRFLAGLAVAVGFSAACASVLAAEPDPVRVRISAALLDEEIRAFLPATLALPRTLAELGEEGARTITLAELKYCGATEKGAGRLRAVIRPSATKAQAFLTASDGCQVSLADLAKRGATSSDGSDGSNGLVLADLEATWKSWELKLAIVHALVLGKGARKGAPTTIDKRADIWTVSTSDLRIDTAAGAPIVLHAAPFFVANAIDLAVVMTDGPAPKAATLERAAAGNRGDMLAGQSNMAAEVPLAVANQVLRRLTWTQPLTIPVDRDEVEVRQVSLVGLGNGESARVTVAGTATPRSIRETMQWSLLLGGDPLLVSSGKFSAQFEDCSGLGTMAALSCNVRNGARGAAAEGFGSALTQRYQGQPVHELASPLN
ncbi:MAG TPA: hypothetical protein VIM14_12685, partial [Polyangia bacterium]